MSSIQKRNTKKTTGKYQQKKDRSMLFLTLAVLGLFVGLLLIIGFYSVTLISFYTITKFLVGFGIVGFLIPLKLYQKWLNFIKYEMIIFNIIGVAPLFTGLMLLLNFTITTHTKTETYNLEKAYFDNGRFVGIVLENNAYADEPRIVEFSDKTLIEIKRYQTLNIKLDEGIFGFDVVVNREFSY
ncbi:MAG: hypothetical protein ACPGSL_00685 [Vicingaceae bacterium]